MNNFGPKSNFLPSSSANICLLLLFWQLKKLTDVKFEEFSMAEPNDLPSEIGNKIKEIRESEGLTRRQFSRLTGISLDLQRRYEGGRTRNIRCSTLLGITEQAKLGKYALWLMTDRISPESGQIAPALSLNGPELTAMSHLYARRTG